MKIIIVLTILLLLSPFANANREEPQPFTVSSSVDRNTITIGDIITYTINIKYRKDIKPIIPGFGINLGSFEVKDFDTSRKESRKGNYISKKISYKISTFLVGEYAIPPIEFSFIEKGKTNVIKTEPIRITVKSVRPSEAEDETIRDIKFPIPIKAMFPYFIVLIILILVFLIAGYLYLRYKHTIDLTIRGLSKEIEIPPYELALKKLKALESSPLLEQGLQTQGAFKEFYFVASEILREYLEKQFKFPALEMITPEIIEKLEDNKFDEAIIAEFKTFLEACDLVKFAKLKPGKNEINSIIPRERKLIEKTKPKEETTQ